MVNASALQMYSPAQATLQGGAATLWCAERSSHFSADSSQKDSGR
jgi:hypothetical protein